MSVIYYLSCVSLPVIVYYLSFQFICHFSLYVIPHCLSFTFVPHKSLYPIDSHSPIVCHSSLFVIPHCHYPLTVIIHYLTFTIVCHLLSVIYHCPSFLTVYHFQLWAISPLFISTVSTHSLLFTIVCHTPPSVIYHCLSFLTICHSPLSAISHCLSFPTKKVNHINSSSSFASLIYECSIHKSDSPGPISVTTHIGMYIDRGVYQSQVWFSWSHICNYSPWDIY